MSRTMTDQELIDGLRALMKARKVSVKTLAAGIGIPYRTLQNYLIGETRFPASVFLSASEYLGVDQHYIITKSFELAHCSLVDAIIRVFGDSLCQMETDIESNGVRITDKPITERSHRNVVAAILAAKISREYHKLRSDDLGGGTVPHAPPRISDVENRLAKKLVKPDNP
jgi:hypothetical protein